MRCVVLSSAIAGMAMITAPQAIAADGRAIYSTNCAICHNNLTPKLGDKVAWGPRIKQGEDALVAAVINGKGAMPPRLPPHGVPGDGDLARHPCGITS